MPPNDGTERMLRRVLELPDQLDRGARSDAPPGLRRIRGCTNVFIAGMGGSAIGGRIIQGLLLDTCPIPIQVCTDYDLPAAAGPVSLVIAVSHSGNTEETISAYQQARRRGCRVATVTGGGKLGRLASLHRVPTVRVPTGMPPRAALGHIFAATLAVLEHSSICHGLSRLLPDTAWFLRRQQSALHHRAKFIARLLVNRLPVVYSLARATDAVADRWRCQLNENAGVMCHTSTLPEHNHNELVGMGQPAPFGRQAVLIVLVDRPDTHARTQRRLNSVLSVTRGSFSRIVRATSRGPTRLARVFSLIMLGDLVSVELARLRGKDAMEIDRIDRLKKLMARTRR